MPHLQIATINYDHVPLEYAKDGDRRALTLGQQIDKHIAATVAAGKMVSEVALHFETREEQVKLAEVYRPGSETAERANGILRAK